MNECECALRTTETITILMERRVNERDEIEFLLSWAGERMTYSDMIHWFMMWRDFCLFTYANSVWFLFVSQFVWNAFMFVLMNA